MKSLLLKYNTLGMALGPFDLLVEGVPVLIDLNRSSLLDGTIFSVDDSVTEVIVQSTGVSKNYSILTINKECVRPTDTININLFYKLKSSITGEVIISNFTTSFIDACNAWYSKISIVGLSFSGKVVATKKLKVGSIVYSNYETTDCYLQENGYYLTIINDGWYIVQILEGIIVNITIPVHILTSTTLAINTTTTISPVTSTTTTQCINRPAGTISLNLYYGYEDENGTLLCEFKSSYTALMSCFNSYNYIVPMNIRGISAGVLSFEVGRVVYQNFNSNDCTLIEDGWYIVAIGFYNDHIIHIVNGIITEITDIATCERPNVTLFIALWASYYNSITNVSVLFTSSFILSLTTYNTYNSIPSYGMYGYFSATTSMSNGGKVYGDYMTDDCYLQPDGYYIVMRSGHPYIYHIESGLINGIYDITNGVWIEAEMTSTTTLTPEFSTTTILETSTTTIVNTSTTTVCVPPFLIYFDVITQYWVEGGPVIMCTLSLEIAREAYTALLTTPGILSTNVMVGVEPLRVHPPVYLPSLTCTFLSDGYYLVYSAMGVTFIMHVVNGISIEEFDVF